LSVPGSTSNLGPGFDTIGLAVQLYNDFLIEKTDQPIEVIVEGEGADVLEAGRDSRTYRAFAAACEAIGRPVPGVRVIQRNAVPLARGLGGSATAVLAGVVAAFVFADEEPDVSSVLDQSFVVENHPDNLTPSLVGGLTVSAVDGDHVVHIKASCPTGLSTVTLIPDRPMLTAYTREVVPKSFSREDAVFNVRCASLLVAALLTGEMDKVALGMQDRFHQPYRTPLLHGMQDIFHAALAAGSPGVALSGGGSGIFAFALEEPQKIGEAMKAAATRHGMDSYYLCLPIDHDGLRICDVS
jgi:homoserine kinase